MPTEKDVQQAMDAHALVVITALIDTPSWTWDKGSKSWLYGEPDNGCGVSVARTDHFGAVWGIIVTRNDQIETNKEAEGRDIEDVKSEALAYLFFGSELKGGTPTDADMQWALKAMKEYETNRS